MSLYFYDNFVIMIWNDCGIFIIAFKD